MMFPLREAFPLFVQDNPGIKISFSKFCAFKPEWIKIANQKQTHVVCMCIKHQNPKLSFQCRNKRRITSLHCIEGMLHRQWNVHDGPMWRLPWRRSPDWIPNSETAKWWNRFWFPVDGSRQYKPCNYCNYGVGDFIEDLVEDLMKLINHHFVAKKQAEFYRYWKGNLKEGECLITCAIAQNYTSTIQDESTFFFTSIRLLYWPSSRTTAIKIRR